MPAFLLRLAVNHAYVLLAAARNRGKITRKAVILVSQKRKESRNIAARMPMLIYANTPSTGLQKIMKKVLAQRLAFRQGFE